MKDIVRILSKLNTLAMSTLNEAVGLCVAKTNYEVTIEHWLVKCLERQDSDIFIIFKDYEELPNKIIKELLISIEEMNVGCGTKPSFSPVLVNVLFDAWIISSVDFNLSKIRTATLLLAILQSSQYFCHHAWYALLSKINVEKVKSSISLYIGSSVENYCEEDCVIDKSPNKSSTIKGGFIERFCKDYTKKALDGQIDPIFGRDEEIRQIIDILARRRKNNPILVGEPGVGKTAAIEGLALRIVDNDVPEVLQNVRLIELDMALLQAGAGMKGEFENRLRGVIQEINSSPNKIILFIDEAHTLIGAGGNVGGNDCANLLKPALARGELRTCAATTWSEYKKYFEKDPALARRFQLVKMEEPSVETTSLILRGLKEAYEKAHNVVIRDEALEMAAIYADRYISSRFLPDKAIDLLDTACARVKINIGAKPSEVEDLYRKIQAIERRIKSLNMDFDNDPLSVDSKVIGELNLELSHVSSLYKEKYECWQTELKSVQNVILTRKNLLKAKETGREQEIEFLKNELEKQNKVLKDIQGDNPKIHYEVTKELIAQVVSDWTGIPLGRMARNELDTIKNIGLILKDKIKGQDEALDEMATILKNSKSGLREPKQPIGVFLLTGPSGVGKTQTAITLAEQLFGSQKNLVTINMSEFQEKHSVSRLVGSPPGYIGYGEGGELTEAIRKQPYSVVLLDEVEKAHPDILNLFYQVFDKGVLSDGEGKEINFSNTVILLTSNLATEQITKYSGNYSYTELLSQIRPILNNYFKPALLARMNVLLYRSLPREALFEICNIKLQNIILQLKNNNNLTFSYEKSLVEFIVNRCENNETGARNIDFIIDKTLFPLLSDLIIQNMTTNHIRKEMIVFVDDKGVLCCKTK